MLSSAFFVVAVSFFFFSWFVGCFSLHRDAFFERSIISNPCDTDNTGNIENTGNIQNTETFKPSQDVRIDLGDVALSLANHFFNGTMISFYTFESLFLPCPSSSSSAPAAATDDRCAVFCLDLESQEANVRDLEIEEQVKDPEFLLDSRSGLNHSKDTEGVCVVQSASLFLFLMYLGLSPDWNFRSGSRLPAIEVLSLFNIKLLGEVELYQLLQEVNARRYRPNVESVAVFLREVWKCLTLKLFLGRRSLSPSPRTPLPHDGAFFKIRPIIPSNGCDFEFFQQFFEWSEKFHNLQRNHYRGLRFSDQMFPAELTLHRDLLPATGLEKDVANVLEQMCSTNKQTKMHPLAWLELFKNFVDKDEATGRDPPSSTFFEITFQTLLFDETGKAFGEVSKLLSLFLDPADPKDRTSCEGGASDSSIRAEFVDVTAKKGSDLFLRVLLVLLKVSLETFRFQFTRFRNWLRQHYRFEPKMKLANHLKEVRVPRHPFYWVKKRIKLLKFLDGSKSTVWLQIEKLNYFLPLSLRQAIYLCCLPEVPEVPEVPKSHEVSKGSVESSHTLDSILLAVVQHCLSKLQHPGKVGQVPVREPGLFNKTIARIAVPNDMTEFVKDQSHQPFNMNGFNEPTVLLWFKPPKKLGKHFRRFFIPHYNYQTHPYSSMPLADFFLTLVQAQGVTVMEFVWKILFVFPLPFNKGGSQCDHEVFLWTLDSAADTSAAGTSAAAAVNPSKLSFQRFNPQILIPFDLPYWVHVDHHRRGCGNHEHCQTFSFRIFAGDVALNDRQRKKISDLFKLSVSVGSGTVRRTSIEKFAEVFPWNLQTYSECLQEMANLKDDATFALPREAPPVPRVLEVQCAPVNHPAEASLLVHYPDPDRKNGLSGTSDSLVCCSDSDTAKNWLNNFVGDSKRQGFDTGCTGGLTIVICGNRHREQCEKVFISHQARFHRFGEEEHSEYSESADLKSSTETVPFLLVPLGETCQKEHDFLFSLLRVLPTKKSASANVTVVFYMLPPTAYTDGGRFEVLGILPVHTLLHSVREWKEELDQGLSMVILTDSVKPTSSLAQVSCLFTPSRFVSGADLQNLQAFLQFFYGFGFFFC